MAEFTLLSLKNEIDNDPESLGYKTGAVWKSDQEIYDLINNKIYIVDKPNVEMEEIRATTLYDWYDTLAIDEQEYLRWLTPNGGAMVITDETKTLLAGRLLAVNGVAGVGDSGDSFWAFAHRTAAAAAMLALIEVSGSRAEVLWGQGTTISLSQIGHSANE